jgi:RNA polymerase sigma-70 factor, ECF subfamily
MVSVKLRAWVSVYSAASRKCRHKSLSSAKEASCACPHTALKAPSRTVCETEFAGASRRPIHVRWDRRGSPASSQKGPVVQPEEEFVNLLTAARHGDARAMDVLMPAVYDELRRIARRQMHRERSEHTLQPTAVVHEAYLRLIGGATPDVTTRAHFMALAARVIRRVLIDHADAHNAEKRGGDQVRVTLGNASDVAAQEPGIDMRALHEALERFKLTDARAAEVVELHYFGGMTYEEVGIAMDLSVATVKREWTTARLWLKQALSA